MIVCNESLTIRELEDKDKPLLVKWLSDPRVLEFYEGRDNPFDLQKVEQVFYDTHDDEVKCLVHFDGVAIGYIQYYPLDVEIAAEHGYISEEVFAMDQFIGEPEYWNKGVGALLVSSMTEFLKKEKSADVVAMDPQTRNTRAIRCYEKCGFQKVKLLPESELHEGAYQDCWLMELRM
ncbi:GNAT family N-acetyltransferase [Rossellomorea aquimaris]|uniref:Acetyltransferase n=1 Tax=Rossellomorea aquimaris TaxID=189382 RepID=A0A5D4TJM1_9BACI|nr:GNAT family N-acetyltransferase [Rossellomorea aquimaris]TYS75535.1 acetyltransferase [Rossellomorea aquimaris]